MTDPDNQVNGNLIPVYLPRLGESIMEATVLGWLKNPGDYVEADEPLVEVSTDKDDTELPAPVSGYLREVIVAADETVLVGSELGVIEVASPTAEHAATEAAQVHWVARGFYLVAPPWVADVIEPSVSRWLKVEGDRLTFDETILDISTQHGDVPLPCPVSGILRSILISEERIIASGDLLALIEVMVPDSLA